MADLIERVGTILVMVVAAVAGSGQGWIGVFVAVVMAMTYMVADVILRSGLPVNEDPLAEPEYTKRPTTLR